MLQSLGNDPKREHLRPGHSFIAVGAISQDTGQFRNFSHPAPIVFQFRFDREIHGTLLATIDIGKVYSGSSSDAQRAT